MWKSERFIVYGALVALALAVLTGPRTVQADGPEDKTFGLLKVRELQVVGPQGQPLASIGHGEGGGFVRTRNDGGVETTYLGTASDSRAGLLTINQKDGTEVVKISRSDQGGLLSVHGNEGLPRVSLTVDADGGVTAVHDAQGDARVNLWVDGEGDGLLSVTRTDGGRGGLVGCSDSGGYVSLYGDGPEDRPRARMAVTAGGGYVEAFNKDYKQSTFLGVASNTNAGLLQLNRPDGGLASEIGGDDLGGRMKLYGADLEARVVLSIDKDGGRVGVLNNQGQSPANLWVDSEGDGLFTITKADGTRVALMGAGTAGGYISTYRDQDHRSAFMGPDPDGRGAVETYLPDGALSAHVGGNNDGGSVLVYAKGGTAVGFLGASTTSGSGMVYVNRAGGDRAAELTAANDGGRLMLWNGAKNETVDLTASDGSGRGAGLSLARKDGTAAIVSGVRPEGDGGIDFVDRAGTRTNVQDR